MNQPTPVDGIQALDGPLSPPLPSGANQKEAVMRDEMFDRDYQAGRDALHDGIDRLVAGIGRTLKVLNSIQFDAPWKHGSGQGSARSVR
jgi:hypothetical protein